MTHPLRLLLIRATAAIQICANEEQQYEATRKLRNSADLSIDTSLRKVPVIALTASAIKGDREKCEAAGMVRIPCNQRYCLTFSELHFFCALSRHFAHSLLILIRTFQVSITDYAANGWNRMTISQSRSQSRISREFWYDGHYEVRL
jgi:CheY-like chemotaxis protein